MKKIAFTLAEIMIVMTIIGIVAEMTIPTLMQKVQKETWATRLQKFYSTQSEGWARVLSTYDADELSETELFHKIPDNYHCNPNRANDTECKDFYAGLRKFFRFDILTIKDDYQTYLYNGGRDKNYKNNNVMLFQDGTMLIDGFFRLNQYNGDSEKINAGGGQMYSSQNDFVVDVNGIKGPNKWGKDIFDFLGSGDGKLFPRGGKDVSLINFGDLRNTWQNSRDEGFKYGFGLAAKVMEDGWKINY